MSPSQHVLCAGLQRRASLANTVPGTFWALAFLLLPQHADHKSSVLESVLSGVYPFRMIALKISTVQVSQAFNAAGIRPGDPTLFPNVSWDQVEKGSLEEEESMSRGM